LPKSRLFDFHIAFLYSQHPLPAQSQLQQQEQQQQHSHLLSFFIIYSPMDLFK